MKHLVAIFLVAFRLKSAVVLSWSEYLYTLAIDTKNTILISCEAKIRLILRIISFRG